MLREVLNVQQAPGEAKRRWFFCHEQDLSVWFGEDGAPLAFQLAYGKYRDEHAIRWKAGRGFAHERVDDGENGGPVKATPIVLANGLFPAQEVLEKFLELSAELPPDIAEFVAARLREYAAAAANP